MGRKRTIVGLDIGQHSVKAVWMSGNGRGTNVLRSESMSVSRNLPDPTSEIRAWIEKMGVDRHPCVVGVPGTTCIFQPVTLPAGDPRTEEQAAAVEIFRFNEMAGEDMHFGYVPFSVNPHERRILLAMARASVVDTWLQRADALGLDLLDLVPAPVALYNGLRHNGGPGSLRILANIGGQSTETAFILSDDLVFARAFASGGQALSERLRSVLKIPAMEAERRKCAGISLTGEGDASDVLRGAVDAWIDDLQSCVSVYRNVYTELRMDDISVEFVGGGARLDGLCPYVADKTGWNVTCSETGKASGAADPIEYAMATGLAASGFDTGAVASASLLPKHIRDELAFRVQKPFWVAAGIVAALILGVSLLGGFRDLRRREAQLRIQQDSLSRRQRLAEEIEHLKGISAGVDVMAEPVTELVANTALLPEFLTLVADSLDTNDMVTMICDAHSYFIEQARELAESEGMVTPVGRGARVRPEARQVQPEVVPDSPGLRRVVIEGYTATPNLSTVRDLIATLDGAEWVLSADLLNDDKLISGPRSWQGGGRQNVRSFVIDVKLVER